MKPNRILELMPSIELFKELDMEEKQLLAVYFEKVTYPANEMIFVENSPRENLYVILEGEVELFRCTPFGEEKRLAYFGRFDTLGEGAMLEDSPHSTSARALADTRMLIVSKDRFQRLIDEHGTLTAKIISRIAKIISRRMRLSTTRALNAGAQYHSGQMRSEHDLLGEREVPWEAYYGVQTLRGLGNFNISGVPLSFCPLLIEALAMVKMAAARANS